MVIYIYISDYLDIKEPDKHRIDRYTLEIDRLIDPGDRWIVGRARERNRRPRERIKLLSYGEPPNPGTGQ